MLLNNFFYIDHLSLLENRIEAEIHVNEEHGILKGHFPGQPVVPGVCVLEMMKEVLQQALKIQLIMSESAMIKFLTVFSPLAFKKAFYEIDHRKGEGDLLHVNATLRFESTVFFKFKGIFSEK